MSAVLCGLLAAPPAEAAPEPVVLVPIGSAEARCLAEEALAANVALASGVELVRTAVDEREGLDEARRRVGADVALGGLALARDGVAPSWTLELAREGAPLARFEGPELGALLRRAWPESLPPLRPRAVAAAANAEALSGACHGDAARAYASSGTAVGPALWMGLGPPPVAPRADEGVGLELARTLALAREGRHLETLARAPRVVARLARGESWPVWRSREPIAGAALVAIVGGETAAVFGEGALSFFDLATGTPLGRAVTARIAAPLVDLGDGLVLAAGATGASAIDARTGSIRWAVELPSPWPEVTRIDDRLFLAGSQDLLAVRASDGGVLWRLDRGALGGPVGVGGALAIADETELTLVDPGDGKILARADLGDEISGALVRGDASLWCSIGADRVARVEIGPLLAAGGGAALTSARPERSAGGLRGLSWPPVALGGDAALVAALDPRRGPQLFRVDGVGEGPARLLSRGPVGPLLPIDGGLVVAYERRRDALLAIDPSTGQIRFRLATGPVRELAAGPFGLVVASGSKVRLHDPRTGRLEREVELGEPLRALAAHAAGLVAVGASGLVYGLAGIEDPRVDRARFELAAAEARAAVAIGDKRRAEAAWGRARAIDPDDLEAALALGALATPERAAAAWLGVLASARPRDEAAAAARAALGASIGLTAIAALPSAPTALFVDGEQALAELDVGWVSIDAAGTVRPRAAPAAPPTAPAPTGALALRADGALVILDARRRPVRAHLVGATALAQGPTRAFVARGASILVLDPARTAAP